MRSLHSDLEGMGKREMLNPWNRDQEGNISKYNRLLGTKYIYEKLNTTEILLFLPNRREKLSTAILLGIYEE